jgi:RND superfamily putative drug exporter
MSPPRKHRGGSSRGPRLAGLGGILTRHPRLALGSWILVVAILAFIGRNLPDELHSHPLYIDGTEPAKARDISLRQFGSDESMVVVLRGPRAAVDRQGRELAGRIDALPKTVVVSPWSARGTLGGLRPQPRVAGLVVRVGHRSTEGLARMLELVEGTVGETVSPPVDASVGGLPRLFESYVDANKGAARTGEAIAIPVLMLVLLLVFRSVVAALIPVIVGGVVAAATQGVMRSLLGVVEIDAFALGAAAMMGLALGVDYSLLVVSRFREERLERDLPGAVQATVAATPRSIIPAAAGLSLAMLIAAQILPGTVVSSSALTIVIATVLSAVSALVAVPAAIMLLGDNLERWTLPRRFSARGAPLRISNRLMRRPRVVGAFVVGLLLLAALASTLDSGVATPELLPPEDKGRLEEEKVSKALGPGWLAPIEIIVSGSGEPMTSPKRLHSLVAFQNRIAGAEGVQTVAGLGAVASRLKSLSGFERRLLAQQRGVTRLRRGIVRTQSGARRSVDGLSAAAGGAGSIGSAAEKATAGADLLVEGLGATHTGSTRLAGGLQRTSDGAGNFAEDTSKASSGAARIAKSLEDAKSELAETQGDVHSTESAMQAGSEVLTEVQAPLGSAEDRLGAAWGALQQMTTGKADPQYAALENALRQAREYLTGKTVDGETQISPTYAGVADGIVRGVRQFELGLYLAGKISSDNGEAQTGTEKLANSAERLDRGVERLAEGAAEISSGTERLLAEGTRLSPALQRLQEGTEHLATGLGRLGGSAATLAGGLGSGVYGSERLAGALSRLGGGLASQVGVSSTALDRLRGQAPNLFRSGYFYLAGLDGAGPAGRDLVNFVTDLERGGHTARLMVIPRYPITTSEGRQTLDLIRDEARQFAGRSHTQVVVGGLAASQVTIGETLTDRTELARIAMMLITIVIMVLVLRSLIVPTIAAFLNLLTVSATIGVLALLFNGSLLGGPGYVDAADIPAVIMVIFGLAIDYEVFVFARMREEYVRTGSPDEAVDNGLAQTAPVVTGAAVIMIVVFLCFSVSQFITLRNFGVAQAIAVFIDAFIIRLIVLPAIMKGLGRWSWWMPGWLDRLLPGSGAPAGR